MQAAQFVPQPLDGIGDGAPLPGRHRVRNGVGGRRLCDRAVLHFICEELFADRVGWEAPGERDRVARRKAGLRPPAPPRYLSLRLEKG